MHVLILSFEYPPLSIGGIGIHSFHLAQSLEKLGERVTVVSAPSPSEVKRPSGPPVYREIRPHVPHPREIEAELVAESMMKAARMAASTEGIPDLIHCQECKGVKVAIELSREWNVPLICTVHSSEALRRLGRLTEEHYQQETARRAMIDASDIAICVSNALRQFVEHVFGFDPAKLRVVHNGTNTELTRETSGEPDAAATKVLAHKRNRKMILYVGRLAPEKGLPILVQSAHILAKELGHEHLWFCLAGSGRLDNYLYEQICELGLQDTISLTGNLPLETIAHLYVAADLVVLPSLYDTFPLTALEALAAQKPLLASAVGGLPELVKHGSTGFLVEHTTPRDWANAIISVLNSPEEMQRCAAGGRQMVLERFATDAMGEATLEVYHQALRRRAELQNASASR